MKRAVPGSWAGITGSTQLPDVGPAGGREGDGLENVAEALWQSYLAPYWEPAFFSNARRTGLDDGLKAGKWHGTFYFTESNREDKCKRVRMGVMKANSESLSHEPQLQGQILSQTVEMEQRDRPSTFWTQKSKAARRVDNGSLHQNIDHGALCSGLDVCQAWCFRGKALSFPRHYRVLAEAHLTDKLTRQQHIDWYSLSFTWHRHTPREMWNSVGFMHRHTEIWLENKRDWSHFDELSKACLFQFLASLSDIPSLECRKDPITWGSLG